MSLANREPVATWSFKRLQLVKEPVKSNRTPNQEDAASTNETVTKWKLHDENKLSQHRTTIASAQTCKQEREAVKSFTAPKPVAGLG